jgi:hypothetical protein
MKKELILVILMMNVVNIIGLIRNFFKNSNANWFFIGAQIGALIIQGYFSYKLWRIYGTKI